MSSRLCLAAPRPLVLAVLAWALALSGCADSHARGGEHDCNCCGVTVSASASETCSGGICDPYCSLPADGGPLADAPVLDAGRPDAALDPTCGPHPFDLVCFDHVRAGVPTTVELVAGMGDDCFCGQDVVCDARVIGDHALAIDTSLCPAIPICRACAANATGACELPALDEGTWRVSVNGEDALDLEVVPADVMPERADVCVRRAIVDGCGAIFTPMGFSVGRACHPDRVAEGTRAAIHVFDACGGCVQRGPCEVVVLDGTIRVSATRMPFSCDIACPSICAFDEHVCITPPLAAGSYRVTIDGLPTDEPSTIEVGAGSLGGETCVP